MIKRRPIEDEAGQDLEIGRGAVRDLAIGDAPVLETVVGDDPGLDPALAGPIQKRTNNGQVVIRGIALEGGPDLAIEAVAARNLHLPVANLVYLLLLISFGM